MTFFQIMDDIELTELFCINKCAKWVLAHNYSAVGLEFAENLHYAPNVYKLLKNEIGFSPVVLESSNRACGNCCVDEATARPRNIEAIIHFGRTCLTPTRALPVLYVLYPNISIDTAAITNILVSENCPRKTEDLILVYDILCTPYIGLLFACLKEHFPYLISSSFVVPDGSELIFHDSDSVLPEFLAKLGINEERSVFFNSRRLSLPPDKALTDYNFIYIGSNNQSLEALQMRFSTKTFYIVSPTDNTLTVSFLTKSVMARSKKLEQIKEAKTIGLISTIIKDHREISGRLKKLITLSNKRYYSFYMGKINEAKLANIVGVDLFVYIGCPESSLFDRNENTYLYKNIVTPWELEVTLNPSTDWSLNFETNFRELLKEEIKESEKVEEQSESESSERTERNASSLVQRNPGAVFPLHADGAAQSLMGLSWQGLNPEEESAAPVGTVFEGRKGIAVGYDSETKN